MGSFYKLLYLAALERGTPEDGPTTENDRLDLPARTRLDLMARRDLMLKNKEDNNTNIVFPEDNIHINIKNSRDF